MLHERSKEMFARDTGRAGDERLAMFGDPGAIGDVANGGHPDLAAAVHHGLRPDFDGDDAAVLAKRLELVERRGLDPHGADDRRHRSRRNQVEDVLADELVEVVSEDRRELRIGVENDPVFRKADPFPRRFREGAKAGFAFVGHDFRGDGLEHRFRQ
jgi:hypothetical protein